MRLYEVMFSIKEIFLIGFSSFWSTEYITFNIIKCTTLDSNKSLIAVILSIYYFLQAEEVKRVLRAEMTQEVAESQALFIAQHAADKELARQKAIEVWRQNSVDIIFIKASWE